MMRAAVDGGEVDMQRVRASVLAIPQAAQSLLRAHADPRPRPLVLGDPEPGGHRTVLLDGEPVARVPARLAALRDVRVVERYEVEGDPLRPLRCHLVLVVGDPVTRPERTEQEDLA